MNEANSRPPSVETERAQRRAYVATWLITSLMALAYKEAVPPVRDSMQNGVGNDLAIGSLLLFVVFFLTNTRFFIGNYIHMQDLVQSNAGQIVWLYDLLFIVLQAILFIFLAGVCSVKFSREHEIHFVLLLLILYGVDVIWILSQLIFGKLPYIQRYFKRNSWTWQWLVLNLTQAILILVLVAYKYNGDFYSQGMLWWLAGISMVAFYIDVVVIDRSHILW
jgi:hypothetical protein